MVSISSLFEINPFYDPICALFIQNCWLKQALSHLLQLKDTPSGEWQFPLVLYIFWTPFMNVVKSKSILSIWPKSGTLQRILEGKFQPVGKAQHPDNPSKFLLHETFQASTCCIWQQVCLSHFQLTWYIPLTPLLWSSNSAQYLQIPMMT